MNATPHDDVAIGFGLPWLTATLDSLEQIAALVPEDKLDWRLADPSGKWHFSLAEIVMHSADARRMFARMLTGSESTDGYWSTGPGEDGVWPFKPYGTKQTILDSLKESRAELQPFLDRPLSSMSETTEGTRKAFERNLARMRERQLDTANDEKRGPASVLRILMACAVHESGHRSSLQTLLRMHGINLGAAE